MKGIFITGTDTNVGKTYVGCEIAAALVSRNIIVIPRKPIESGCKLIAGKLITNDATKLQQASQSTQSIDIICPFKFSQAISPARAARLNKQNISVLDLKKACLNKIDTHKIGVNKVDDNDSFLLVEGAGGFYSPICDDGLNADLARALALPVILIAENKLGCINQVLLNIEAIQKQNLTLKAIVLNKINNAPEDDLFNHHELSRLTEIPVLNFNDTKHIDSLINILLN